MPTTTGDWTSELQNVVGQLPSTMARLELLAAFQAIAGEAPQAAEAEFLLSSLHTKTFSDWLNYTLEEQHADLSLYFSGLPCGKSSAVRHWLDSEPYPRFIPASASPAEDRLFVADLKILLSLIAYSVLGSDRIKAHKRPPTQVELIPTQELSKRLSVPQDLLSLWAERHGRFLVKAGRGNCFSMTAIREWLVERTADSQRPVTCRIRCSESGSSTLSAREHDVLKLIGEGKRTKEIAECLCLTETTIAEYRKRICKKLDLHSTGELVACAVAQLTGTCRMRAADGTCPL